MGNPCTIEGIMCTRGDTGANAKRVGSIRDGHLENREAQVGHVGGLLALFARTASRGLERKALHCCLMAFDVLCTANKESMHR